MGWSDRIDAGSGTLLDDKRIAASTDSAVFSQELRYHQILLLLVCTQERPVTR
jgi:hypothetical protein